jgi:hypothetical protein
LIQGTSNIFSRSHNLGLNGDDWNGGKLDRTRKPLPGGEEHLESGNETTHDIERAELRA